MKYIAKIIFYLINFFDVFLQKVFNKKFLFFLKDLIENKSYTEKEVSNKKIVFFTPNSITKWRVDTLFTKEPETISWIDSFDGRENFVFWDIGANIGLYSIYAALKFKNISVVSFEPSTSNIRVLSRNISINNLQEKIIINQLPLSDKENQYLLLNEREFIEGYAENTFGKKIDFTGKNFNPKNSYKILGSSIKYLISQNILKLPNYIKIDVDGIEHLILKGAGDYLSDKKLKSISIEINENFKEQYDQVTEIMKKSNFNLKHKKRANEFFIGNQSKIYNYLFEKK